MPVMAYVRSAGSSGIPQIIGLLNGCDLRADFTWKHLLAKLLGVTMAVSSGLAVGPEGPMIFIGAAAGFAISKLPQQPWVWRIVGRPPATVGTDVYLRDYVSIGAGCGIAAAFRAPIAGTLFIVEEAASHFDRVTIAKIFFGGLAALQVIIINNGAGSILEYAVTTGPGCSELPGWSVGVFIIIGIACGLAGALFNHINAHVTVYRTRKMNPTMPLRRLMDLMILCIVTGSVWVLLPAIFGSTEVNTQKFFERSDGCVKPAWKLQIIQGSQVYTRDKADVTTRTNQNSNKAASPSWLGDGSDGGFLQKGADRVEVFQRRLSSVSASEGKESFEAYIPRPCFYGVQFNPELCKEAWGLADKNSWYAQSCTTKLVADTEIASRADKTSYCCAFDSISELQAGNFMLPANATCPLHLGESMPSLQKKREDSLLTEDSGRQTYNPMAAMTLIPFKETCQNLFSRGVPYAVPLDVMLVFFVVWFLAAALTAGSAIPSGLLMPQMLCGALVGRIISVLLIDFQAGAGLFSSTSSESSIWSPAYQPFFHYSGGPLTGDAPFASHGFFDPGVGAVVGAAAFLGGSGRITLFTTVMMVEITGDPLMIFPVGVATIVSVIVGNYFNHGLYHTLIDVQSQPFLSDSWPEDEIPSALRVADVMPRNKVISIPISGGRDAIKEAIDGNNFAGFPVVDHNNVYMGIADRAMLEELLKEEGEISVRDATDLHEVTCRPGYPLRCAYQLFKQLELKQLVVVDDSHVPQSVMTRFAFLPWRIQWRLGHERMNLLRKRSQRGTLQEVEQALDEVSPTGTRAGRVGSAQLSGESSSRSSQDSGLSMQAPGERSPTDSPQKSRI
eukprot:TRINITY_DN20056_c0_g1_i1.p1 TRINITY_DN20056_c0_g1~~TRINITY_DN20056_c0_g1_i1.p1  ORF type:complete len:992 (-),score=161.85 TRINITY_DN20056_c0_g1_i1:553-3084(-)